jgi:hypothetical protein
MFEAAADHRLHGGDEIERARLIGDAPPVAQNDDPVGDALDISEAVRNVEHADAALAQAVDDAEQPIRFRSREAGGRLVEDQHRRVGCDGARDRDELAMRRAERGKILIERDVEADAVGDHPCAFENSAPGDERTRPATAQLIEQKVFSDGQPGNAKLIGRLMDDDDSGRARRLRRRQGALPGRRRRCGPDRA